MVKEVIRIGDEFPLPLIGHIAFGLIDRGTNVIQVRPISGCPLNCIYCSVDEGPKSRTRKREFFVELEYLMMWAGGVAKYKNINDLQWHIDCAGEATLYKDLVGLIKRLKEIKNTSIVSIETRGTLLNKRKVRELADAGLDRVNISVDSLDDELAKEIAGTSSYDVNKVINVLHNFIDSNVGVVLAPVWVPGINDNEMPKIINLGKEIGASFGIQNYEIHKYGRKVKGVKALSFHKFFEKLRRLEKKFNVKLKMDLSDFNIHRAKRIPTVFKRYEKTSCELKCPGWIEGETIGVARDRCIAVYNIFKSMGKAKIKILRTKDNIYLATGL